ncbi:MAG TPA: CHASE3 domain-containing protein [Acetobacteraceae bacterium]
MSDLSTRDDAGSRPGIVRWVGLGSLLAVLLLILALLTTAWNIAVGDRAAAVVTHDRMLLDRAEAVLFAMKDLETGGRGFLLTGVDEFLGHSEDPGGVVGANLKLTRSGEAFHASAGGLFHADHPSPVFAGVQAAGH